MASQKAKHAFSIAAKKDWDAPVEQLLLDTENPRLASGHGGQTQDDLIRILWTEMAVDEVAFSIAANGFFREEPLLVISADEVKGGKGKFIVIEGNRRLAAVLLLRDAKLREKLKVTGLPPLNSTQRAGLDVIPVVQYPNRESLWTFCGFRHINGAKPWDAFSKAQYVATVHEQYHVPLDEIAKKIGDQHSTVRRLYRGYKVLEQAEKRAGFSKEDQVRNKFYFSHLYTAVDQIEFQKFLGIGSEKSLKPNPVPESKIQELGELMTFLYGQRSTGKEPLVRTQSPDLNKLREVISKPAALSAIRSGLSLDRAYDIGTGDKRRFRESLTRAKEELQQARGTVTKGYFGEDDLFETIGDIELIAGKIKEEMEDQRKKRNNMLSLPKKNPTDTIQLADWLEIYALISGDRNSSRGDLESALRTASLFEPEGDEAIQRKILDVFQELEDRTRSAKEAYPFILDGGVLRVKRNWEKFPVYVFCLCLSYFGANQKTGSKAFPRRWFEHISRDALKNYLGGESLRFGSPRLKREIPVGFKDAINFVCNSLKEGEGYKAGGLIDRKDDAVDIIAWRHFPDQLPGKLIVFGNCATERDWEGAKKTELTPAAFCSDWMIDAPKCAIISSLFIPHRVEYKRFLSHLKRAGIIFDRCRVSYWAYFSGTIAKQIREKRFFNYRDLTQWSHDQLKVVKS